LDGTGNKAAAAPAPAPAAEAGAGALVFGFAAPSATPSGRLACGGLTGETTGFGVGFGLGTVSAVWYRRVAIGQRIPETMDPQLRRTAIDESRATVHGMIASLDAYHLDPVHRIRRAENKQLQLKIARELGLSIPRTLITNQPEAVRRFARECDQGMVMKTLTSFSIYERGEQQVVFTNAVRTEDLEHLGELRYCPATFQERLPKTLELRATIVGGRVFTAAIDSQQSDKARVDWRRDGIGLIDSWQPYALPVEVEQGLLKLMRALEISYGAADLILTPEGRHVFLEVNPNGEFFWLEKHPGLPLTSDFIFRSPFLT